MEDLKKAENTIERLMQAVSENDAWSSPVLLSQLMVRLAYSVALVGRKLAGLQGAYRIARREVYQAQIAEHGKVTRAKEEAENASREQEMEYDHYKNIHDDTQIFINVCQSHLKILSLEAKSQL